MIVDNLTGNIDIIAPFHVSRGDNWHAIDLLHALRSRANTTLSNITLSNVTLWSAKEPHAEYSGNYQIHTIRPFSGGIPTAHTLLIFGSEVEIGSWYLNCAARHIVLITSHHESNLLYKTMHKLNKADRQVRISYMTHALKHMAGLPGEVALPAFDAERFLTRGITTDRPHDLVFKVGRASRDVRAKHHFRDPSFYRQLISAGMHIEIAGGTCLAPWLEQADQLRLMPVRPHYQLPDFLHGLDCFFYRTSLSNRGGIDRILLEAMACGLPVVTEASGSNQEFIENGENGFLFKEEEEARHYIIKLRDDEDLRSQIGIEARNTILNGIHVH